MRRLTPARVLKLQKEMQELMRRQVLQTVQMAVGQKLVEGDFHPGELADTCILLNRAAQKGAAQAAQELGEKYL